MQRKRKKLCVFPVFFRIIAAWISKTERDINQQDKFITYGLTQYSVCVSTNTQMVTYNSQNSKFSA